MHSDSVELPERLRLEETFRRLHRLTAKGYVPELSGWSGVDDAIFLNHLADGPKLILYPSGMLVCQNHRIDIHPHPTEDQDGDRIYNHDAEDLDAFAMFLATVRSPTWWERGKPARERYILMPGCMLIFLLVTLGLSRLLQDVWRAFWK